MQHAGVQHDGVEAAEHLDRVAHRAVDRLAVARVGLEERRAVAAGDALAALAVAPGQHDARALRAQPLHHGLADAGRATRHQRAQVVETPHPAAILEPS